jgi:hypothetical protein
MDLQQNLHKLNKMRLNYFWRKLESAYTDLTKPTIAALTEGAWVASMPLSSFSSLGAVCPAWPAAASFARKGQHAFHQTVTRKI